MIKHNSFGRIPYDWPSVIFYRNPPNRLCLITLLITIWTSYLTGAISRTFTIVPSPVAFTLERFKFRFPLISLASRAISSIFSQPFLVTFLPNNSLSISRISFLINLLWPPGTVQIHTLQRKPEEPAKSPHTKTKKLKKNPQNTIPNPNLLSFRPSFPPPPLYLNLSTWPHTGT